MMHEKLSSKGTHSLYTFIKSEVRKWQSWSGKSDKNKLKNYIQTTCTSADSGENMQSFKKTGIKLYEELQSQSTVCTFEVRKWRSTQSRKKWWKLMQGLYQKHMDIQTMAKTCAKLQKDWYKGICMRSCAHKVPTVYILRMEKDLSSQCGKSDKEWSNSYIQTTCISSYHGENTCKVS